MNWSRGAWECAKMCEEETNVNLNTNEWVVCESKTGVYYRRQIKFENAFSSSKRHFKASSWASVARQSSLSCLRVCVHSRRPCAAKLSFFSFAFANLSEQHLNVMAVWRNDWFSLSQVELVHAIIVSESEGKNLISSITGFLLLLITNPKIGFYLNSYSVYWWKKRKNLHT